MNQEIADGQPRLNKQETVDQKILLDLFAGRLGWSKAFLARGWKVYAVDLVEPSEVPYNCHFIKADVLTLGAWTIGCSLWTTDGKLFLNCFPDFIVASSPCEEFSVHGMKLFHPNPKYPEVGIKLFNHTRALCEAAAVPYVMENVRAAQAFVGQAVNHCGPWFLWGNAVPPLFNQGITKGAKFGAWTREQRKANKEPYYSSSSRGAKRDEIKAKMATIPPELANCIAAYAERLLEQRAEQRPLHREAAK